jgi:hypothetical protein
MATVVDTFAQVFPGLEMRDVFTGQGYGLARLRVSANSGWAKVQREAAKPANFDALALGQRVAHQVQKVFHSQLDIFGWKVLLFAGDNFY